MDAVDDGKLGECSKFYFLLDIMLITNSSLISSKEINNITILRDPTCK